MSSTTKYPYATPEINAPTPMAVKYLGQATKDFNNSIPKVISAPVAEFEAAFEKALASYIANGGDKIRDEIVGLYRKDYGKQ